MKRRRRTRQRPSKLLMWPRYLNIPPFLSLNSFQPHGKIFQNRNSSSALGRTAGACKQKQTRAPSSSSTSAGVMAELMDVRRGRKRKKTVQHRTCVWPRLVQCTVLPTTYVRPLVPRNSFLLASFFGGKIRSPSSSSSLFACISDGRTDGALHHDLFCLFFFSPPQCFTSSSFLPMKRRRHPSPSPPLPPFKNVHSPPSPRAGKGQIPPLGFGMSLPVMPERNPLGGS